MDSDGEWLDAYDDYGYTYVRYYWNSGTSASAYANYTHMTVEWSSSFNLGFPLSAGISFTNTTVDRVAPNAAISWLR